jgi:hypothetical protein
MFLRRTGAPQQTWQIANLDTKVNGHGQGITSVDPAAGVALLKLPRVHVPHVQRFVKPHLTLTPAIMNGLLLRSLVFNDRDRNPDTLSRNKCDYIMLMPEVLHPLRAEMSQTQEHPERLQAGLEPPEHLPY